MPTELSMLTEHLHNKNTVIPGSRWQSRNGADWVTATVQETQTRGENCWVYFTVAHRPGETLSCLAEAFQARYAPDLT